MSQILEIKNVHKYFESTHILKGVDLVASKGDVIAILGPSGSGKTTLLKCINFLELPSSGSIKIGEQVFNFYKDNTNKNITFKNKDYVSIRRKVSMIFQHFNLWMHLTALENIIEAPIHVLKKKKKVAREEGMFYLKKVGLMDFAEKYPNQLSGGQKQRVAIARALAMHPDIILMDEPVSSLDPELVQEVLEVILKLSEEGITMLVVTHQIHFSREVSNKIVFLFGGLVKDKGKTEDVCKRVSHSAYRKFFIN